MARQSVDNGVANTEPLLLLSVVRVVLRFDWQVLKSGVTVVTCSTSGRTCLRTLLRLLCIPVLHDGLARLPVELLGWAR